MSAKGVPLYYITNGNVKLACLSAMAPDHLSILLHIFIRSAPNEPTYWRKTSPRSFLGANNISKSYCIVLEMGNIDADHGRWTMHATKY